MPPTKCTCIKATVKKAPVKRSAAAGLTEPTIESLMAEWKALTRQVRGTQETLDERMTKVDRELAELHRSLTSLTDREDRDAQRTIDVSALSERLDRIGQLLERTSNIAELTQSNVVELTQVLGERRTASQYHAPELFRPNPKFVLLWRKFQKSWAGYLLGMAMIGFVCYTLLNGLVLPQLQKMMWKSHPGILQPGYDVHTPVGAASLEVSREPFRSDSASRRAFGIIFARLDELVRTGQITDYEGYYNECGRGMQAHLDGTRYGQWAGVWDRIATVCLRHGNGAYDLRVFHANLYSAAKVISDVRDFNVPASMPGWNVPGHVELPNAAAPRDPAPIPNAATTPTTSAGQGL